MRACATADEPLEMLEEVLTDVDGGQSILLLNLLCEHIITVIV